ncbi:hypothetical protein K491DRAFT_675554 [Lophiostoma macrostomum CBS 122681]|uniref:Uncharacterized protein n=1 Tax=Lophiostoma macrostomum CBS 122681 TaxID=1314788 RepID=A0A6A6TLX4_9PLEO|nr:hypothetical protein K491DRAFT_675554 [Lophiostoma macrostomum CBS 122681]
MAKTSSKRAGRGRGRMPKPTKRPSPERFQQAANILQALNGEKQSASPDSRAPVAQTEVPDQALDSTLQEDTQRTPQCKGRNPRPLVVHNASKEDLTLPRHTMSTTRHALTATPVRHPVKSSDIQEDPHVGPGVHDACSLQAIVPRLSESYNNSPRFNRSQDVPIISSHGSIPSQTRNRKAPKRARRETDNLDGFIISDTEDDDSDIVLKKPCTKRAKKQFSRHSAVADNLI